VAQQIIETTTVAGVAWINFVDVQKPGVLWGLAVAGGTGYHYVRVTLDGTLLADNFLSGIFGGPAHGNTGLTVGLYFDRDLLVEVRNGALSPQTVFWASYAIWGPPAPQGSRKVVKVGAFDHVFEETEGRTVLVGPARTSSISLYSDTWFPDDTVQGAVELRGEMEGELFEPRVPILLRPAGRQLSVGVVAELSDVHGSASFEIEPGIINEVGGERLRFLTSAGRGLELVTNLGGYANLPAPLF
jgi:hypothetical protein